MLRYKHQQGPNPCIPGVPRKALGVMSGARFVCKDCGEEHQFFPSSNPKHDYLFFYCENRLKLAAINNFVYI